MIYNSYLIEIYRYIINHVYISCVYLSCNFCIHIYFYICKIYIDLVKYNLSCNSLNLY